MNLSPVSSQKPNLPSGSTQRLPNPVSFQATKKSDKEPEPAKKLHDIFLNHRDEEGLTVFVGDHYTSGAFEIVGEEMGQICFKVNRQTVRLLISNYVCRDISIPSSVQPISSPDVAEFEQPVNQKNCFSCSTTEAVANDTSQRIDPSTDDICQAIIQRLSDINRACHEKEFTFPIRDDIFDTFYKELSPSHATTPKPPEEPARQDSCEDGIIKTKSNTSNDTTHSI